MPVTRSSLFMFGAGLAAGAAAYATYPRWKHKVDPLLSAVKAGASAAFQDAQNAADAAAGESQASQEPARGPSVNGFGVAAASHL